MSTQIWTIQKIITWTTKHFESIGIETSRLDAEVLLASVLSVDRIYLYTHFDKPLSSQECTTYRALVLRRAKFEPVAYILGKREFFGRPFKVTPDVLIPRPETEHLVECAAEYVKSGQRWLDLCTGSGSLAVTFALEHEGIGCVASDISEAALCVAKQNIEDYSLFGRVECVQSNLFEKIEGKFDGIVSNPPYVSLETKNELSKDVVNYEPHLALFAQNKGLELIFKILEQAPDHLKPGGVLIFEFGFDQEDAIAEQVKSQKKWASFDIKRDLQNHPRVAF